MSNHVRGVSGASPTERTPKQRMRPNSVLRRDRMAQQFFCSDLTLESQSSACHWKLCGPALPQGPGERKKLQGVKDSDFKNRSKKVMENVMQVSSFILQSPQFNPYLVLKLIGAESHGAQRLESRTSLDRATIHHHNCAPVGLADQSPPMRFERTPDWSQSAARTRD